MPGKKLKRGYGKSSAFRESEYAMSISSGLPQDFTPSKYDAIVVGAGYAGAVCARMLAEGCNMRIAVLERRDHIAGNAYDYVDEAGVLVHKYGPHIYHTFDERVHQFLTRFSEFTDYQHKVLANINGTLMPVPFNHKSLVLAFGEEKGEHLYQKLVMTFGENKKVPIMELRAKNDPELAEVADYVYENVFLHYTMKQWGKTPDQIDPAVMGRVPVFVGDDDRYFPQAPYQGMPAESYTALFEHMLDHDLIEVYTSVDARDLLTINDTSILVCDQPYGGEIIYTGPLDELFNLDLGALPYRTLDMQFETLDMDQFQPVGTVNYTVSEDFTRITEFKNMTGQVVSGKTTIMREYSHPYEPGSGQTPYYVINEPQNIELYERYRERVSGLPNFHVVGRLAEYRYYDMDGVVASALDLSDEIINQR
jgi:UDP-galactopyranose mutase